MEGTGSRLCRGCRTWVVRVINERRVDARSRFTGPTRPRAVQAGQRCVQEMLDGRSSRPRGSRGTVRALLFPVARVVSASDLTYTFLALFVRTRYHWAGVCTVCVQLGSKGMCLLKGGAQPTSIAYSCRGLYFCNVSFHFSLFCYHAAH